MKEKKAFLEPRVCKNLDCQKEHDGTQIKRSSGEWSTVYLLGYCCARCYTKATIEHSRVPSSVDSVEIEVKPIVMKTFKTKSRLDKILIITAISAALLWLTAFAVCGQEIKYGTPEYYAALGIEPLEEEQVFAYKPIYSIFDSVTHFTSYFAENQYGEKQHAEPNVKFLFNKRTVAVSGCKSDDPKKMFRILGVIDFNSDKDHTWRRFQCEDKSGTKCVLSINLEFQTNVESIIIAYPNTTYYYEVVRTEIPAEPYFILDNIADESIHNKFGADYTNEEVYEFLAQFGTPSVIINFMLRDLFYNQDFGVDNKPQEWQKQEPYKYHPLNK